MGKVKNQIMKFYNKPEKIDAIIFDIDSTLYTNSHYAFEQVDCQIREFAKLRKISNDDARKMVSDYREKYALENDGKKISLGNVLLSFGVSIEKSVEWRKQLLEPADFLSKDEKLIKCLEYLENKYKLICVTNNPILPARKTLEALGVNVFFPEIVGLDTCFKSKPAFEPFEKAIKILNCNAQNVIAVGDRYDMDISIPLEMGMGGILVKGVEDIYDFDKYL